MLLSERSSFEQRSLISSRLSSAAMIAKFVLKGNKNNSAFLRIASCSAEKSLNYFSMLFSSGFLNFR